MGHCYANLKGGFASLGPGVEQRSARGRITGFEKMTWLKSENLPQMREEKEERKNSWIRMFRNAGYSLHRARNNPVFAIANSQLKLTRDQASTFDIYLPKLSNRIPIYPRETRRLERGTRFFERYSRILVV